MKQPGVRDFVRSYLSSEVFKTNDELAELAQQAGFSRIDRVKIAQATYQLAREGIIRKSGNGKETGYALHKVGYNSKKGFKRIMEYCVDHIGEYIPEALYKELAGGRFKTDVRTCVKRGYVQHKDDGFFITEKASKYKPRNRDNGGAHHIDVDEGPIRTMKLPQVLDTGKQEDLTAGNVLQYEFPLDRMPNKFAELQQDWNFILQQNAAYKSALELLLEKHMETEKILTKFGVLRRE